MLRITRARIVVPAVGIVGTAVALLLVRQTRRVQPAPARAAAPTPVPTPKKVTENVPIKRGDTLDDLLGRAGVAEPSKQQMISAVRAVFNVRKLQVGSQVTLVRGAGNAVESLEYSIDPDHRLRLSLSAGVFRATVVEVPGVIRVVPVCAVMRDSLFDSVERAGERPELALQVAEIFGWDLDFYTDPREGDPFCVLLEKKEYANGQPSTYRRVLAARYNNAGTVYEGFLFEDGSGRPHFYSRQGHSLQAAFLRSPMKFEARVSSHFSRRRFHPILKIYRPHLGTDYAAPAGTPVQAVASGRVVFSGYSGSGGNTIRLRHANGYESMYMHLSRILVRAGQRVDQGRRIGLVGATGLATGPHLDFRLRRDGRFVNFERFRPPRATKLTAEQMARFAPDRDRSVTLMDEGQRAASTLLANGAQPAPAASAN